MPLIRKLQRDGDISWFSFLVHSRRSGVPTEENDSRLFVHLRLAHVEARKYDDLVSKLPSYCEMTRRMPAVPRDELDNNDVKSLRDQDVEWAWAILGAGSEWILTFLESHDIKARIAPQSVSQQLHYIGNALMVRMVGILMP